MRLIQSLQKSLEQYLIQEKSSYVSSYLDTDILQQIHDLKIPNETQFGLFKRGDTGLKRVKFLIKIFNQWRLEEKTETEILNNICFIYNNNEEPPKGLGNSKKLRKFLALSLSQKLNVSFSEEEYKQRFQDLITTESFLDAEIKVEPSPQKVSQSLLLEKTIPLIKNIVEVEQSKKIFLQGLISKKTNSSIHSWSTKPTYDPKLQAEIFKFITPSY